MDEAWRWVVLGIVASISAALSFHEWVARESIVDLVFVFANLWAEMVSAGMLVTKILELR